jgi:hypothetical protein
MSSEISPVFTPQGLKVSTTAEVKEYLSSEFKRIFGAELNTADYTPQGQLITSLTAIIQDKDTSLLDVVNNFNPELADGVYQDAIAAIYFLTRRSAEPSVAACVCEGLPGTYIPGLRDVSPATAISTNDDLFVCMKGGTIGDNGSVTLDFCSDESAPIRVEANTINKIYKAIRGWDTVNNPEIGTMGAYEESRADFETRRRVSVQRNATGTLYAVYSNIMQIDDVIDCLVRENPYNQQIYISSKPLNPHSIYVVVEGGESADIANAIYLRKSLGCDTNGSVAETVIDSVTGAEYTIRFDRATRLEIIAQISVLTSPDKTADDVRTVIIDDFSGKTSEGETAAKIGKEVYASRFYKPLFAAGFYPTNIKLGYKGIDNPGDVIYPEIFEIPTIETAGDIEVTFV